MIELGDKVKDTISGFVGVAIGRTQWIYGCDRIIVQPLVGKDGKMGENASFDEPSLTVVSKKKVKVPKLKKTGGFDMNIRQKSELGR